MRLPPVSEPSFTRGSDDTTTPNMSTAELPSDTTNVDFSHENKSPTNQDDTNNVDNVVNADERMDNVTMETTELSDNSHDDLDRVVEQLTNDISDQMDDSGVFDEEVVDDDDNFDNGIIGGISGSGEERLGAMNPTMAAGGFEEIVMAEEMYNDDEADGDDIIEEYVDESYEEEIIEDEMMDDEDLEEIMEEAKDIMQTETAPTETASEEDAADAAVNADAVADAAADAEAAAVAAADPAVVSDTETNSPAIMAANASETSGTSKVAALIEASERSAKSNRSSVDPLMGRLSERSNKSNNNKGMTDQSGRSTQSNKSSALLNDKSVRSQQPKSVKIDEESHRSNRSTFTGPTPLDASVNAQQSACTTGSKAGMDKSGRSTKSGGNVSTGSAAADNIVIMDNKSARSTKSQKSTHSAKSSKSKASHTSQSSAAKSVSPPAREPSGPLARPNRSSRDPSAIENGDAPSVLSAMAAAVPPAMAGSTVTTAIPPATAVPPAMAGPAATSTSPMPEPAEQIPGNIEFVDDDEEEDVELVEETVYESMHADGSEDYVEEVIESPVRPTKTKAAVVDTNVPPTVAAESSTPSSAAQGQRQASGSRNQSPATTDNAMMDLEAGLPSPSAGGRNKKNGAPKEKSPNGVPEYDSVDGAEGADHDDDEEGRSKGSLIWAGCLCLMLLVLIIVLPLVLIKDKSREIEPPIVEPVPETTLAPVVSPAMGPTSTPTRIAIEWTNSLGLVEDLGGPEGSGFGSAVAIDESLFSVGAPLLDGRGSVISGVRTADGSWTFVLPSPEGEAAGANFGAAIDILGEQMVVGAPTSPLENSIVAVGATYFYSIGPDGDSWVQIGDALRGDADVGDASGEFGAAVALGVATLPRTIVGAPKTSSDDENLESGRVYTFEGTGIAWEAMGTATLIGKNANDYFGSSVDMTDDGSRFIVGAPGNGTNAGNYFQIYEWDGSEWVLDFEGEGSDGEKLGASVHVLSTDGDVFAVGGPGYKDGAGRVAVYQRKSDLSRATSDYVLLGEVVGGKGDQLGSPGTVSGGTDDEGIVLVLAASSGTVETLGYDSASETWERRSEPLETSGGDGVMVAFSVVEGVMTGLPSNDHVNIYNLSTRSVQGTAVPINFSVSSTSDRGVVESPSSDAPVMAPPSNSSPVESPPTNDSPDDSPSPSESPVTSSLTTESPVSSTNNATVDETDSPTDATAPTSEPTVSPIVSTDAPVVTETSAVSWELSGESFGPRAEGSSFGSAVSLSRTRMVVGAPTTLGNGAVFVYQKSDDQWESEASGQLFGDTADGGFGASVDITDRFLVVGAPSVALDGTLTSFGAVYCYISNDGNWEARGEALFGDGTIFSANEMFGASVSASSNGFVAVGAPVSNIDSIMGRGRVYVFQYSETTSEWSRNFDAVGSEADVALGSAVDISSDGGYLLAGAPGGNGYVELFQFDGSSWVSLLVLEGEDGEAFGSSVDFISLAGDIFVVGAPSYSDGQGRIAVYQRNNAGVFAQIGPSIIGSADEKLGAPNTVAGDGFNPSIIFGSATGVVRRLNYDADTDDWVQHGGDVDSGFGGDLTAIATASLSEEFVVGGNVDAHIYATA